MDEGGGLENRYMGNCIVGSNPTPSAISSPGLQGAADGSRRWRCSVSHRSRVWRKNWAG